MLIFQFLPFIWRLLFTFFIFLIPIIFFLFQPWSFLDCIVHKRRYRLILIHFCNAYIFFVFLFLLSLFNLLSVEGIKAVAGIYSLQVLFCLYFRVMHNISKTNTWPGLKMLLNLLVNSMDWSSKPLVYFFLFNTCFFN